MPGLVRKLLIIAAVDGLVLQPYGTRNNGSGGFSPLRIEYKTRKIQSLPLGSDSYSKSDERLEAHGIVGKFHRRDRTTLNRD